MGRSTGSRALNGLAPTILDLWVDERGDLKIVETTVPVPGT